MVDCAACAVSYFNCLGPGNKHKYAIYHYVLLSTAQTVHWFYISKQQKKKNQFLWELFSKVYSSFKCKCPGRHNLDVKLTNKTYTSDGRQLARSCTSRNLICADGNDQLTSTRGNFTSVRGVEFIFFCESIVWGEGDTKFKKWSNFFFYICFFFGLLWNV